MRVERKQYTDRLLNSMHNGMVKVITGARRSGKSFLLFNLFRSLLLDKGVDEQHIISIALDDLDNVHLLDNISLHKYIKSQMASLQNIDDSFKKIIITHSEQKPWYNQQGILILALHDFLLDDNSIEY